ncbi:MAG: polyketide synthase dehydratase domain-containing protein, partial [Crocosphaera sp.]
AQNKIPKGVLLTVGALSPEKLQALLQRFEGRVHSAMTNCPNQSIIFGYPDEMEAVKTYIEEQGGIYTVLPFDRAYHTPLFSGVSEAFRAFYDVLDIGESETPLYSCVNGQVFPGDPEAVRTLAARQWSSEVKFWETIETFYNQGIRTFIEVGPSSNLKGFVDDILRGREYLALSSNHQRKSGLEQIQNLLGCLWVNGAELNFAPLYEQRNLEKVDFNGVLDPHKGKQKQAPILELNMPIMGLRPDFIAEIQTKLQPQPQIIEKVVEKIVEVEVPAPAPGMAEQPFTPMVSSPSHDVNPEKIGPSSSETLENPEMTTNGSQDEYELDNGDNLVVPTVPVISDHQQRLHLLYNHLELMQEFLASQGRVTAAFNQTENHIIQLPEEANYEVTEQEKPVDRFPLLGEIVSQDQSNLVCERRFNLERDIFLYDHTIGGDLSQRHPELIPLPVIPFTVSMEILAEASLYLTGATKFVVGIYDSRGYRWLALDQGELTLKIEAQLLPQTDTQSSSVKVRLFQTSNQTGLKRHLVFEGTVKLADEYPQAPAPIPFQFSDPAQSRWADEQLYKTGMFHGPLFQGVKHIRAWDKQGIEADLAVIAIDDFFSDQSSQPLFQIDSGLLDAAGQLVGYWFFEQFGTDFNVFPFNVESFEQYESPLPSGSYILCRGLMKFVSDRQTRSSFDLLD